MAGLCGKTVLLLGAGKEQIAAIQAARGLGLRVVAADGSLKAPGLALADRGVNIDIRDVEAVYRVAKSEHADGIFCHAVELPQVVAEVTQRLKLPGLDPDVADRATNKLLRYQCFQANQIPCPRFRLACNLEEAFSHAKQLGFPVVMKPIDNAGARGVRKVAGLDEVEAGFRWVLQSSRESMVLIEEFLEGLEISTESIVVDGQIITTGFADRNYDKKQTYAPYFIEDGHTIPTALSAGDHAKVLSVVERAIRALGIDWGVAKGDVILHAEGPKVFEMAARTSGGRFCSDMVPLATGVNILIPLISLALGEKVPLEDFTPRFHRAAAQRFLFPPPGGIVDISGVEEASHLPGVYDVCVSEDIKLGGVVRPLTNHGDRVGHVIASGETRQEAVQRAELAIRTIRIETITCAGVCP